MITASTEVRGGEGFFRLAHQVFGLLRRFEQDEFMRLRGRIGLDRFFDGGFSKLASPGDEAGIEHAGLHVHLLELGERTHGFLVARVGCDVGVDERSNGAAQLEEVIEAGNSFAENFSEFLRVGFGICLGCFLEEGFKFVQHGLVFLDGGFELF